MTTMSDVLLPEWAQSLVVMVWYDMVYVDLYSAIIAKLSNALYALVPRKQPSFQDLFKGAKILLCAKVAGSSVFRSGQMIIGVHF